MNAIDKFSLGLIGLILIYFASIPVRIGFAKFKEWLRR